MRNGKSKEKGSRAKRIFLGIVGIIVLLIVLLVLWVAWGKNLGEQVSHTPFAFSNDAEATEHGASVVYMTTDISPEGMLAIYEALGVEANGNVAVKLSTGEAGVFRSYVDDELRKRLETKLIIAILSFDLN